MGTWRSAMLVSLLYQYQWFRVLLWIIVLGTLGITILGVLYGN